MENPNTGVDWLLVGINALAAGSKAFFEAYKPQTANFQTAGFGNGARFVIPRSKNYKK